MILFEYCTFLRSLDADDVNVITNACAVKRGVISSKNTQTCTLPKRHLVHVRHEGITNTQRVLTNPARRVRTHRVEVAQQHDAPAAILDRTGSEVSQHLLLVQLRAAIRRDRLQFAVLCDRPLVRESVDSVQFGEA